jgi:diguanylate cyclase (GGDEF)-like protein
MFLDIDKFKRINDSYGHPTGDEVLRSVARLIQSQLRSGDTIARHGGEEFVVLLPKSELHHALQIAERIRAGIEEKPFQAHSGQPIRVTISIGLSMLPAKNLAADNLQCAEQLVAAADQALYQAKHKGRNRVECAGGLPPVTVRRLLSSVLRNFARSPLAIFSKGRGV